MQADRICETREFAPVIHATILCKHLKSKASANVLGRLCHSFYKVFIKLCDTCVSAIPRIRTSTYSGVRETLLSLTAFKLLACLLCIVELTATEDIGYYDYLGTIHKV